MTNRRHAVLIGKKAKNNVFDNCEVIGGMKIEGKGTVLHRTRVRNSKTIAKRGNNA